MSYRVSSITQPSPSGSSFRKSHVPVVESQVEKISTVPIPHSMLLPHKLHGAGLIRDTKLLESRERYAKLSKQDLRKKEHRKKEDKGRSRDRTMFARVSMDSSDAESLGEDPSPRTRSHSPRAFHGGIHALDTIMLRMPKSSFEGPNPCSGALFFPGRLLSRHVFSLFCPPLTCTSPLPNPPPSPPQRLTPVSSRRRGFLRPLVLVW